MIGNMARELWVKKASVPLLAELEACDLDGPEESFVCGVGGCKAVFRSNAGSLLPRRALPARALSLFNAGSLLPSFVLAGK